MTEWNSRYVSYARTHGHTPETMLEHDEKAWPGGKMTGFMLWIQERWQEWDRAWGHKSNHVRSTSEHAAFTAWLEVLEVETMALTNDNSSTTLGNT